MGCWSREAGGGAGSASGGRSHRWVGRQAAAPSPLPRGGGRAGTETSGTTAPAAGPQQGERAAVSRRRPAGRAGPFGQRLLGQVRAGPGGKQAADPGPRSGARARTPRPRPRLLPAPRPPLAGRAPSSKPPRLGRAGIIAAAVAGSRPEPGPRVKPGPGGARSRARAPRGSWRGRGSRCWLGAAASARATAAWTSAT